ncbi:MAG: ABC transporter permease [Ruthenibacterium sp.]
MTMVKGFLNFLMDIVHNRSMLWGLAKNDFKARFASSLLGIIWAFVQPLVTILVMWFVFQVGLRNAPIDNIPFIVWFAPGFLIWSFFSETLSAVTNSMREYGYLVTKVNFRVSIIPLVKIISGSFVHIAFIGFIVFLNGVYGILPTAYYLQVFYYFFCTIVLLIGLGWLLSAIAPFAPDVSSLVAIVIQIGFWVTPIVWNPDSMSPLIQTVLKLNPMYYICRGYRDAFIENVWFWQRGWTNLYFWAVTAVIFVLGAVVFKKMRPQFADVL